jgi:DNA invertase Pin-like site-specific DNA recombinase
MKFVAYYRVSTDKQGRSGLGLEAQQKAVRDFLAGKGWPPLGEFEEVESGKRSTRPKLREALSICRVHGATLVVAKLDRLSRNAHFLGSILESGVEVVFLDLPNMAPGPVSTFMLQQMAAVAQLEAGLISERTKAALKASKARGVKLGGDRGYRPTHATSLQGAAAKREIADRRAGDLVVVVEDVIKAGHKSLGQIADELNRREIPTPSRRGTWKRTMVSRVLQRTGSV